MTRYYFAIALGWTWFFWAFPIALDSDPWTFPAVVFLYLGGAGPLLAGITMTIRRCGRAGLSDLGVRTIDPRRISGPWWLAVLMLIPLIEVAAGAITPVLTDDPMDVVFRPLNAHLSAPATLLASAFFLFVFGPLPEEIGWRGFALDALQRRFSPLAASALLWVAWSAWHAPLFFIDGYYDRFESTPNPALFVYELLLTTLLLTWIYNHTARSILAAILFHFMVNFSGELVFISRTAELVATGLTTLVVVVVIARGGLATRATASKPC